nr:hypothetical protein [Tanacetum cinerariifolium]
MDLSDYEAPFVLVTRRSRQIQLVGNENENVLLYYHILLNLQIQFGREEFCLVSGLRFGVEYWADYDNDEDPIAFRRWVFPSSLDGEHITSKIVEKLIDNNVEGRRSVPDWILRLGYWSLSEYRRVGIIIVTVDILELLLGVKGADDIEAQYDWWVSSRAYFDGVIDQAEDLEQKKKDFEEMRKKDAEREKMYAQMRKFMEGMNVGPVREANKGPIMESQIPSHMGNSNSQTPIETHPDAVGLLDQNITNRGKREHHLSIYRQTPYVEQAPTTVSPKQRGSDDIMFVGGQFTSNMLVYENVDPNKHMNSWMELLIRSRPENAS